MAFDYNRWNQDLFQDMQDKRVESVRAARVEKSIQRQISKGASRELAEKRFKDMVLALTKMCKSETEAWAMLDQLLPSNDEE